MWLERVVLWACLWWVKEALYTVNLSLKVFEVSSMSSLGVPVASTVLLIKRLVVFPSGGQGCDLQLQSLVSMWVDDPVTFLLCPKIIRAMLGMLL